MRAHVLLALIFVLLSLQVEGRRRAARHPAGLPSPRSVLWIAAHPDDEAVIAPLFYKWCIDDAARCGLLVLTRGEAGVCSLAQGCLPDMATVRSAEAGAASELFRADSMLLRYPDGGGVLPPEWAGTENGQPDLETRIARLIQSFDPELIITFDPRHGTTCNPDHREVGRLVLAAVERLEAQPSVYLLETFVEFTGGSPPVIFSAATPNALRFDATQTLASGVEAWSAVAWDLQRHPSQWTAAFIDAVANIASDQRSVFIAPAQTVLQENVASCP